MSQERYTIYDLETPANLFTAGFKDFKTNQRKNFVVHESKNELRELMKFLRAINRYDYTLVGYNCLGFDGQILEYLINNYQVIKHWSGEHIAERIHELAQKIISLPEEEKFLQLIPEWKFHIPHIDIYKQQHYDSKNKRTSLKWLQFTMRYHNIESMPIHHTERVDADKIPTVLSYMDNDVDSTLEFFKRNKFETDLRLTLSSEYNLNLLNASEPRMAREIFGKFLSEEMGVPYRDLKERRTYRNRIYGKDIVFPYIKYNDPILKGVLDFFTKLDFNPYLFEQNNYELEKVQKNFKYHNISADVGLGGIHGCIAPGVYNDDVTITEVDKKINIKGKWVIEDIDATSYYPMIGIKNNLFPEHLSHMFCKVYNDLFEMRQKIEKKSPINYIYKIILNAAYGLSKEPNNYFHDPKYTFSITINGQLLLLKLAELLKAEIPDLKFYQFNTDGVTVGYDPKYRSKVEEIKKKWSKVTKIPLENNFYKKMVIMDVNNYLAIDYKGKVKRKGLFGYSLDPEDKELQYHKNPSALVIPKALEAFFVNGKPYEEFIMEHEDIFDFCCGVKVKRDFNVFEYSYNKETQRIDKEKIKQQVVRYYISTAPTALKKVYKEGSKMALKNLQTTPTVSKRNMNIKKESNVVELEKGWNTTYYNVHVNKPIDTYGLNYKYYIAEIRKVIDEIQPHSTNLKLF
jgi:hypothetical protein